LELGGGFFFGGLPWRRRADQSVLGRCPFFGVFQKVRMSSPLRGRRGILGNSPFSFSLAFLRKLKGPRTFIDLRPGDAGLPPRGFFREPPLMQAATPCFFPVAAGHAWDLSRILFFALLFKTPSPLFPAVLPLFFFPFFAYYWKNLARRFTWWIPPPVVFTSIVSLPAQASEAPV